MKYPWFKPKINQNKYIKNLKDVVRSNAMTMGPKCAELEKKLSSFLGVKHVVLTTSGTNALLMTTLASKIKNGDTVISNNFTWVATTNPAKILGCKIKLVDTKKNSQKIDFDDLNKKVKKYKPKLVYLVHMNGEVNYNSDFEKLKKKYKFFVIEDAAQAIFSRINNKKGCGTKFDIGCYSLGITKSLNMIYGGFCVTNSNQLYKRLITIKNNGLSSHKWFLKREIATDTGLNLRTSDLHASIGLINFNDKNFIKNKVLSIYNYYKNNIKNKKIKFLEITGDNSTPCWPQAIVFNKKNFSSFCKKNNIGIHLGLRCISETLPLKESDRYYPNSIYLSKHLIRLPSGPGYTLKDIKKITKIINKY